MRKPVLEYWSVVYLKTSILVREYGIGLSLVVMVAVVKRVVPSPDAEGSGST